MSELIGSNQSPKSNVDLSQTLLMNGGEDSAEENSCQGTTEEALSWRESH